MIDLHGVVTGIVLECVTRMECDQDERREEKHRRYSSKDVVIDSRHWVGDHRTGWKEEILIFGGMTLEFYRLRGYKRGARQLMKSIRDRTG